MVITRSFFFMQIKRAKDQRSFQFTNCKIAFLNRKLKVKLKRHGLTARLPRSIEICLTNYGSKLSLSDF